MARANGHYIPGCAAIGREVIRADGIYELRGGDVS
jgi:hypothetical protein